MTKVFYPIHTLESLASVGDLYQILTKEPNTYTADQIASMRDFGRFVLMNSGSANSYTINAASTMVEPFPLYSYLMVAQIGAGATSIVGGSGVTINGVSAGTVAFASAGEAAGLWQYATDTWLAFNKTAA